MRLDEDAVASTSINHMDPAIGRFLTPDTAPLDQKNPQSLNRYSYGLNNPLKYIGPTGHSSIYNPATQPRPLPPDAYAPPVPSSPPAPVPAPTPAGDPTGPACYPGSDTDDAPVASAAPTPSPDYADTGNSDAGAAAGSDTGDTTIKDRPKPYLPADAKKYLAGERHSASSIGQPSLDPRARRTTIDGLNKPSVAVRNAVRTARVVNTVLVPGVDDGLVFLGSAGLAFFFLAPELSIPLAVGAAFVELTTTSAEVWGPSWADWLESQGQ